MAVAAERPLSVFSRMPQELIIIYQVTSLLSKVHMQRSDQLQKQVLVLVAAQSAANSDASTAI